MPSHNLYSLSREICYGYRVGFTVEDDLVASRVAITPTEKEDGGFGVEVYSWKNYDPNASTYADATKVERFEYRISLSFHADSTLASGSYLENYYDETTWTFNNSDAENGGSPKSNTKPVVKRKSSFTYGYDAPKAGAPDFDLTPYFTTSISNLSAKSKDMADNVIQLGAVIDEAHDHDGLPVEEDGITGYTSLLKFDVSPATALDKWQLGIVGSSNESVIGRGANRSYCWNALSQGQSTVTIGNHIGSELATLDLTVSNNVKVQGYFVWAPSDVDESVVPNSSNVKMYAGDKVSVYLWASPTNCDPVPTIASSDPALKVTLSDSRVKPDAWNIASYPTYLMTLDATAISLTEQKSVTLTITDPFFDEERGSGSKITVTLMPGASSSTWPASVVGTTWTGNKAITDEKDAELGFAAGTTHCDSSISFTGEDYAVSGYKKAVLSATSHGETRTFEVGYTYDPSSTKVFTFKAKSYDVSVSSSVDKAKGAFGLLYVVSTWNGMDDVTEDYIVGFPEDESAPTSYQWFTLA